MSSQKKSPAVEQRLDPVALQVEPVLDVAVDDVRRAWLVGVGGRRGRWYAGRRRAEHRIGGLYGIETPDSTTGPSV